MSIIVKGKFIKWDEYAGEGQIDETATIELSPRELLEQIPHQQIGELLEMINLNTKSLLPEKPQQEFCKCGFHSEVEKEYNKCMQCGKLIHPEAKKEIEEVSFDNEPVLERCGMLARAINEIIRYLRENK